MAFGSLAGISTIESEKTILSFGQISQIDGHTYGQISHIISEQAARLHCSMVQKHFGAFTIDGTLITVG